MAKSYNSSIVQPQYIPDYSGYNPSTPLATLRSIANPAYNAAQAATASQAGVAAGGTSAPASTGGGAPAPTQTVNTAAAAANNGSTPPPIAADLLTPQAVKPPMAVDATYVGDGSTAPVTYTGTSNGSTTNWNQPVPVVQTGLSQEAVDKLTAQFNAAIANNNKSQNDSFQSQLDKFKSANQSVLDKQNAEYQSSLSKMNADNQAAMQRNNQSMIAGNMDAFKNFNIPIEPQSGVNMGNYNANRKTAADQWWSNYVTGRR